MFGRLDFFPVFCQGQPLSLQTLALIQQVQGPHTHICSPDLQEPGPGFGGLSDSAQPAVFSRLGGLESVGKGHKRLSAIPLPSISNSALDRVMILPPTKA